MSQLGLAVRRSTGKRKDPATICPPPLPPPTHTHTHTNKHARTHTHIYTNTHARTHTHTHTSHHHSPTHSHTQTHKHTRTYAHTNINTPSPPSTHTQTLNNNPPNPTHPPTHTHVQKEASSPPSPIVMPPCRQYRRIKLKTAELTSGFSVTSASRSHSIPVCKSAIGYRLCVPPRHNSACTLMAPSLASVTATVTHRGGGGGGGGMGGGMGGGVSVYASHEAHNPNQVRCVKQSRVWYTSAACWIQLWFTRLDKSDLHCVCFTAKRVSF